MMRKINFCFLLLAIALIAGCVTNNEEKQEVARDLTIEWKIPQNLQLTYPDSGFNACLLMRYKGEQKFIGEARIVDNVDSQFLGLPDETKLTFSYDDFEAGVNGREYTLCYPQQVKYSSRYPFDNVQLFANVKIVKRENVYSKSFCVPENLKERFGCGLQSNAGFPSSSSINGVNANIVKIDNDVGRVYVTMGFNEVCKVVDSEGGELEGEDIIVNLRQSGSKLDCKLEGKEENRKTIKCEGDINIEEEYQESVEIDMKYGCEYKLSRTINFQKREYKPGYDRNDKEEKGVIA